MMQHCAAKLVLVEALKRSRIVEGGARHRIERRATRVKYARRNRARATRLFVQRDRDAVVVFAAV